MDKTYQVRRYRDGFGLGEQVATGLNLEEATEAAFRFMSMQDIGGGNYAYTVQPD